MDNQRSGRFSLCFQRFPCFKCTHIFTDLRRNIQMQMTFVILMLRIAVNPGSVNLLKSLSKAIVHFPRQPSMKKNIIYGKNKIENGTENTLHKALRYITPEIIPR